MINCVATRKHSGCFKVVVAPPIAKCLKFRRIERCGNEIFEKLYHQTMKTYRITGRGVQDTQEQTRRKATYNKSRPQGNPHTTHQPQQESNPTESNPVRNTIARKAKSKILQFWEERAESARSANNLLRNSNLTALECLIETRRPNRFEPLHQSCMI